MRHLFLLPSELSPRLQDKLLCISPPGLKSASFLSTLGFKMASLQICTRARDNGIRPAQSQLNINQLDDFKETEHYNNQISRKEEFSVAFSSSSPGRQSQLCAKSVLAE